MPADAHGAYFAGIVAETPLTARHDRASSCACGSSFPLIVQIEGRTARQEVALEDAVMAYHDGSDGGAATTTAGPPHREQRPHVLARGWADDHRAPLGEHWRPVTRFALKERSIIPGVTLELGNDLQRRLPSGPYRLLGELRVDGRRVPPVEKEIAFEGDPNASTLAYDTALIL